MADAKCHQVVIWSSLECPILVAEPQRIWFYGKLHFSSSVYVLADIRMIFMEAKKKALLEIPPPSSAVLATSTGKVKAVLGRKKRSKYMLF